MVVLGDCNNEDLGRSTKIFFPRLEVFNKEIFSVRIKLSKSRKRRSGVVSKWVYIFFAVYLLVLIFTYGLFGLDQISVKCGNARKVIIFSSELDC